MLYRVPGFFNQISERRHLIRKKVGLPPRRFALCAVVGFAVVRFMGLCRVMRSFFIYLLQLRCTKGHFYSQRTTLGDFHI